MISTVTLRVGLGIRATTISEAEIPSEESRRLRCTTHNPVVIGYQSHFAW